MALKGTRPRYSSNYSHTTRPGQPRKVLDGPSSRRMTGLDTSVPDPQPKVRRRDANTATVAIRPIIAVAAMGKCGVAMPGVAMLNDSVPVRRCNIPVADIAVLGKMSVTSVAVSVQSASYVTVFVMTIGRVC